MWISAADQPCGSGGLDEGVAQVVMYGLLWDSEGTSNADGRQLAVVDQTVDRHLGNTHDRGDLGNGQKANFTKRPLGGC